MASLGTPERLLKFARLLFKLEPDTDRSKTVRAVLESKGLKP